MKRILLFLIVCWAYLLPCGTVYAQALRDSSFSSRLFSDSVAGNHSRAAVDDSILHVIITNDSVALDHLINKKSYFQAALSYLSNNVYLGRKDSSVISYYNPGFGYFNRLGFYIELSAGCLLNSVQSRVDLVTIDGGYQFSGGNYDGEVAAAKYFFSDQSTNVRSEIKASVSFNNSYNLGFVKPSANLAFYFDSQVDYAISLALEHSFYMLNNALEVNPKFSMNGSTENFYDDYFRKRRYTIKRKGQAPTTGVAKIVGVVENSSEFKVFDYEASLVMSYTVKKWTVNFLPVYALPVNPTVIHITKTLENGSFTTKTQTEKLANSFYWTLGFQYNF